MLATQLFVIIHVDK